MAHVARSRVISYTQIPFSMDLKSRSSMVSAASEVQAYCHREALDRVPHVRTLPHGSCPITAVIVLGRIYSELN